MIGTKILVYWDVGAVIPPLHMFRFTWSLTSSDAFDSPCAPHHPRATLLEIVVPVDVEFRL